MKFWSFGLLSRSSWSSLPFFLQSHSVHPLMRLSPKLSQRRKKKVVLLVRTQIWMLLTDFFTWRFQSRVMNEADRKTADIWGHLSSLGTFKASYLTIGGSKLFLAGEPFTLISVCKLKGFWAAQAGTVYCSHNSFHLTKKCLSRQNNTVKKLD